LLADISGYTRFMLQNQLSATHGQICIDQLIETLLREVDIPLTLQESTVCKCAICTHFGELSPKMVMHTVGHREFMPRSRQRLMSGIRSSRNETRPAHGAGSLREPPLQCGHSPSEKRRRFNSRRERDQPRKLWAGRTSRVGQFVSL